jgi:hypothetical protein
MFSFVKTVKRPICEAFIEFTFRHIPLIFSVYLLSGSWSDEIQSRAWFPHPYRICNLMTVSHLSAYRHSIAFSEFGI